MIAPKLPHRHPILPRNLESRNIIHVESDSLDDHVAWPFDATGDDPVGCDSLDFAADDGCCGELEDVEVWRWASASVLG